VVRNTGGRRTTEDGKRDRRRRTEDGKEKTLSGMNQSSEIPSHVEEWISGLDRAGLGIKRPIQAIQFGDEGIGKEIVIVDALAVHSAGALWDAPAQNLAGSGQDLGLAGVVLGADLVVQARPPLMGWTWAVLA
jgi:hypothetical protein